MIKLVDIHKSFGRQKVLDGLTLDIEDGKTTVIIGGSGGGEKCSPEAYYRSYKA